MEGVMFVYGLAIINAFACAILCLISIVISIAKYNSRADGQVKLNWIFIYIGMAFASIVLLLTIALIIAKPDSLTSRLGALIMPLTIALIPLIIAFFANKQVSNKLAQLDADDI